MALHSWVKSTLGHGNLMCTRCKITDVEAQVLGKMQDCDGGAAPSASAAQVHAASNPPPRPTSPLDYKAPAVLIMGDPGTGKTTSLVTALQNGLEVFVIVTEPNGIDALVDAALADPTTRNLRPNGPELLSRLHWSNITPAPAGWATLKEMVSTVHSMNYETIASLKSGIGKSNVNVLTGLIELLNDFVCDRTELAYGDVTTWDDTRMLVVDGISGINKIAKEHTVGFKPSLHMGEWGISMNLEEQIVFKLISDCRCYLTMIAHLDKVPNEITGIPAITMAALGNKLAPQLIKYFSEVPMSKRIGDKFYWSTSELNATVKNRALTIGDKLPPDFTPIIRAHEARKKSVGV